MKSHDIKKALACKHTKDFFLSECKTGSSMTDFLQFDGYAIKKSWTNLRFTGYEIKVSRGDFLQDQKWRGYLPYCNEFYFVCPKDMIKPTEIPDGIGLIYCYPDTHVLRIVKRPKFREIEIPTNLLLYAIMWRVEDNKYPFFNRKEEYFKQWLKNKEYGYYLGREVSKSFSKKIDEMENINRENINLKAKLQHYEKIKEILRENNIKTWNDNQCLEDLKSRLKTSIPANIIDGLRAIKNNSETILSQLVKE